MKKSEIYREVARRFEKDVDWYLNRPWACVAIEFGLHPNVCYTGAREYYSNLMSPMKYTGPYEDWYPEHKGDALQSRDRRILSLLFAAEVAESEGD